MKSAIFSPLDDTLPVGVFISILEYDAAVQNLVSDTDRLSQALLCLSSEDIGKKRMETIGQQSTWVEFKHKLITMFGQQAVTMKTKISLLLSLVKGIEEDCHHFLIRVRHVASVLMPSCSCPPFNVNNDEMTTALFLAGLQEVEREMCLKRNLSLDEYADMLNSSVMTSDVSSTDLGIKEEYFEGDDNDAYKMDLDHPSDAVSMLNVEAGEGKVEILGTDKLREDEGETRRKRCPHPDCKFTIYHKASLHSHLNPVHYSLDEEGFYLCNHCEFRDLKKKVVEIHSSSHEQDLTGETHIKVENELTQSLDPDEKGNYVCQQCHFHTHNSRNIGIHLKKHTERVVQYDCPHCAYTTQSAETLEKHLAPPHIPVFCSQGYDKCGADRNQACRRRRCGKCDFTTAHHEEYSNHIKEHVREVTSADDDYQYQEIDGDTVTYVWVCQHCAACFLTELAKMNHMEKIHLRTLPSILSCHFCSFKTNQNYLKGEHMKPPHIPITSNGQYCCGLCSFETPKIEPYHEHIEGHLAEEGSVSDKQCQHCAKKLSDEETLKAHLDDVHLMSGARHKCPHCSYTAPFEYRLTNHIKKIHQGVKNYQCQHCSKQFSERGNLKRHIETIHLGKDERDVYECPVCKTSLTQKASLTAHMKNVHNQVLGEFRILKAANAICNPKKFEQNSEEKSKGPRIALSKLITEGLVKVGETEKAYNVVQDEKVNYDSCTICDESIEGGTEAALNAHASLKHKGKIYQCDRCEHAFKTRLNLSDHKMRKHHVEPPPGLALYLCQSCPFSSLCTEYIEDHCRTKHKATKGSGGGGQYQCHVCGKDFANKHYVDQHIARTHNKVRNANCPYPDCKFTAFEKSGLRNHLKIHAETLEDRKSQGFTCQECGARSLSKGHLLNHIKAVHRKVKEYGCRICQLRFSNIANCKEHIGLKHMGFKDAKEWRLKENAEVRKSAETHQAFEYVPDQEWQEEYKRMCQK